MVFRIGINANNIYYLDLPISLSLHTAKIANTIPTIENIP